MMGSSAEEGLVALLEAMLTLAASDMVRPKPPLIKPGGFPEEHFLDLTENEKDEFSCNICYQVLKETMQCVNSHKFCRSCLLVWSTTGQYANRNSCPVCRTDANYFRNSEVDGRISSKKVKCLLESCSWSGLLKYLSSHRHTTYSDTDGAVNTPTMPHLVQAPPRIQHIGSSRFIGTGLTLGSMDSSNSRAPLFINRSESRTSPSSLSSTSMETVIEIPRRAATNTRSRLPLRQVPNPGTFNNTRITHPRFEQNTDTNNNLEDDRSSGSVRSLGSSVAGLANTASDMVSGHHTPHPPSAPRTISNVINTRRLPRIINPPPLHFQGRPRAFTLNLNPSGRSRPAENLGEIQDRLQENQSSLGNLVTSFSGELDRSSLEMAEFQQEHERYRQEQLDEVRELGQRLGQVASELRRLLEQRRHLSGFSDDDDE